MNDGSSWRAAVSAALSLFWLSGAGCATVQRAREAQRGEARPPGERTVRAAEVGLGPQTVLSLEEALRIARDSNPQVALARRDLESATAQLQSSRAGRRPTLDASGNAARRTANTEQDRGSGTSRSSFGASLGLDILVYDFGKTPAAIRQAFERLLAAEQSLRSALNEVSYGVRVAFYDLLQAQELLQVADASVRQFEVRLAQVKSFQQVGNRTRYDVTKAEVDLGNARLSRIDASGTVATSRAALNRSLGLAEEPGYRLGDGRERNMPGTIGDLMSRARERHPELQALRAREREASAAIDAAVADLYPSLRAGADYSLSGRSPPLVWNWSALLQAALPVFDGWRRRSRIEETIAQLGAARARLAQREQLLYFSLSQALSVRETARQRLDQADLIVRQATESLDLVNERYRLGKASSVEVTDAQTALTGAQAELVKARFEYRKADAQILYITGDEQP